VYEVMNSPKAGSTYVVGLSVFVPQLISKVIKKKVAKIASNELDAFIGVVELRGDQISKLNKSFFNARYRNNNNKISMRGLFLLRFLLLLALNQTVKL
jgi:hypothetical protein